MGETNRPGNEPPPAGAPPEAPSPAEGVEEAPVVEGSGLGALPSPGAPAGRRGNCGTVVRPSGCRWQQGVSPRGPSARSNPGGTFLSGIARCGTVLDDVPTGAAGEPVAEEEPPDG